MGSKKYIFIILVVAFISWLYKDYIDESKKYKFRPSYVRFINSLPYSQDNYYKGFSKKYIREEFLIKQHLNAYNLTLQDVGGELLVNNLYALTSSLRNDNELTLFGFLFSRMLIEIFLLHSFSLK